MEKYQFKDVVWLITKRGVVIPVFEETKYVKSILNVKKYKMDNDKKYVYNCIVKDVFSEDELKSCLSYMQVISLSISNTLKVKANKLCEDIKDWLGLTDDKKVLRQAYNSLELTDKQIRIIKNELQKYFIQQINLNENRTK